MTQARASLLYAIYNFVVVRDVRLEGWKPNGSAVLEVNHDTPLTWPIKWASDKAAESKKTSYLRLMSHGYPGGMQFAHEHIKKDTIVLFSQLKGLFAGIDLLACGTAAIDDGGCGCGGGDGNFLCYRLAQTTASYVRASRHTQVYGHGNGPDNGVDFGEWQGTVVTWNPKGEIEKIEESPSGDTVPGPK